MLNLKSVRCKPNCQTISVSSSNVPNTHAQAESADNWNVPAILIGDGESHLFSDSYFYSGSLDGANSDFWPLVWGSPKITWSQKLYHYFVDWPYRAVTRQAHLLWRQSKSSVRPNANIQGYSKYAALILIKDTLKRRLYDNPGLCILEGGPGARSHNVQATKYYVRCIDEVWFRISGRGCAIDAACNAVFLLLDEPKASWVNNRFSEMAWKASQRFRPRDEGEVEINDFICVGHLRPVLQGIGDDLRLQNVENVPPHGHREPYDVRSNWLFDKRIHGRFFLARLYEAGIVDHLVVIDSRWWLSLIYDFFDLHRWFCLHLL